MTEIRDAATIVLLRDGPSTCEIFMLRRHKGHAFMANAWVFPGGRLDERDLVPEMEEYVEGLETGEAARRLGEDIDTSTALGLYVAALRETFEEAGFLLARRRGEDEHMAIDAASTREHFDILRHRVDDGDLGMAELCRREELVLDAGELVYLAHWITPDFESRRYDTRFFVGIAPSLQHPSPDDGETTHGAWWSPQEALSRYEDGEIFLAPPTIRILEELDSFDSPQQIIETVRERSAPPAILPHVVDGDGDVILALPGDPEYPGDGAAADDGVTRMVRRDGKWSSVR